MTLILLAIYLIVLLIYIVMRIIIEDEEFVNVETIYDSIIWPLIFIVGFIKHITKKEW